ncbi:histone deacetylase 8-like isoform X1 [Maniola jurtina]|uniref:histone deacetylase 8-like isoform X1 n=2 Tax=Maniola jurtina TaxID=191418 RepID=UPI001E68E0B5|nr:histone deacetylase 8-like isoform X1 [Maniola jurtina]
MSVNNRKVAYIWGENLIEYCDRLPAVLSRASLVHSLITAYGLLNHVKVVRSTPATYSDLKLFHSDLYLDHLKTFGEIEEDYMPTAEDEEYGLGYDCPPISDAYNAVATIAGSSVTAAKCLLLNIADVAINWCGGWHHAHRFGAEGFCYVNDIVIAIEKLRLKYPDVLYVDLDVHHGNGVQDAYNLSKSVFTLSFHKSEPGFYPGTGFVEDVGTLKGKGYMCNFPLQAFYSDETFEYVFDNVFTMVYSCFMPDAIVVQCGADALAHDPLGGAGLTLKGYCLCIQKILDKRKPTLILGGGGYNHINAAKLWTTITGLVTGIQLDETIPEHDFWPKYGPDYTLSVQPLLCKDKNTKEYILHTISIIKENLGKYLQPEDIVEPLVKKQRTDGEDDCKHITNSIILKCKLDSNSENNEVEAMDVQYQLPKKSIDIYEFFE